MVKRVYGVLAAVLAAVVLGACSPSERVPTACIFQTQQSEIGEGDIGLALYLYGQGRTHADVYRAESSVPIATSGMYAKEFIDTGDPYVHQTYNTRDWQPGEYRFVYGGNTDSGERTLTLLNGYEMRVDISCP